MGSTFESELSWMRESKNGMEPGPAHIRGYTSLDTRPSPSACIAMRYAMLLCTIISVKWRLGNPYVSQFDYDSGVVRNLISFHQFWISYRKLSEITWRRVLTNVLTSDEFSPRTRRPMDAACFVTIAVHRGIAWFWVMHCSVEYGEILRGHCVDVTPCVHRHLGALCCNMSVVAAAWNSRSMSERKYGVRSGIFCSSMEMVHLVWVEWY